MKPMKISFHSNRDHFDRRDIRAYSHGLLGVFRQSSIKVLIRGHEAKTDGSIIYLPGNILLDQRGMQVLCAFAAHEVSHLGFESIQALTELLKQFPTDQHAMVRLAANAVFDVADETRLEHLCPAIKSKFTLVNDYTMQQLSQNQSFKIEHRPSSPELLLAAAIGMVRSKIKSQTRKVLRGWRTKVPGAREVERILKKAIDRDKGLFHKYDPAKYLRTASQVIRLENLSKELVAVLNANCDLSGLESPHSTLSLQVEPKSVVCPSRFKVVLDETIEKAGKEAFSNEVIPTVSNESVVKSSPVLSEAQRRQDQIFFERELYEKFRPQFLQAAKALAYGPELLRTKAQLLGPRLCTASLWRYAVDQRVFGQAHWEEGENSAVVIVVDQSGSMESLLAQFLPAALVLGEAIDSFDKTTVSAIRYGSDTEFLSEVRELAHGIEIMGGTSTDKAMKKARTWLGQQTATQKHVVLFTDGSPNSRSGVREEVKRYGQAQINLWVGSIGRGLTTCREDIPGRVFSVKPRDAGSSLITLLRRMRG